MNRMCGSRIPKSLFGTFKGNLIQSGVGIRVGRPGRLERTSLKILNMNVPIALTYRNESTLAMETPQRGEGE